MAGTFHYRVCSVCSVNWMLTRISETLPAKEVFVVCYKCKKTAQGSIEAITNTFPSEINNKNHRNEKNNEKHLDICQTDPEFSVSSSQYRECQESTLQFEHKPLKDIVNLSNNYDHDNDTNSFTLSSDCHVALSIQRTYPELTTQTTTLDDTVGSDLYDLHNEHTLSSNSHVVTPPNLHSISNDVVLPTVTNEIDILDDVDIIQPKSFKRNGCYYNAEATLTHSISHQNTVICVDTSHLGGIDYESEQITSSMSLNDIVEVGYQLRAILVEPNEQLQQYCVNVMDSDIMPTFTQEFITDKQDILVSIKSELLTPVTIPEDIVCTRTIDSMISPELSKRTNDLIQVNTTLRCVEINLKSEQSNLNMNIHDLNDGKFAENNKTLNISTPARDATDAQFDDKDNHLQGAVLDLILCPVDLSASTRKPCCHQCRACPRIFRYTAALAKHERTHTDRLPYANKMRNRKRVVVTESYSEGEDTESYSEGEDTVREDKSAVNQNKLSTFFFGKKLKKADNQFHCCTMCDKRYYLQSSLKYHIKLKHAGSNIESSDHSETTPRFVCNKLKATGIHCCMMCDKRYRWLRDLRYHIAINHLGNNIAYSDHSKQTPHSVGKNSKAIGNKFHCCTMCDKRYYKQVSLKYHIALNHPGNNFASSDHSKTTPHSVGNQLKATGNQFHCCTMCDKRCYRQKDLKSHILQKHPGNNVASSDYFKATPHLLTYPLTLIDRNVNAEKLILKCLKCSVDFTDQSGRLKHKCTMKPTIINTDLNCGMNEKLTINSVLCSLSDPSLEHNECQESVQQLDSKPIIDIANPQYNGDHNYVKTSTISSDGCVALSINSKYPELITQATTLDDTVLPDLYDTVDPQLKGMEIVQNEQLQQHCAKDMDSNIVPTSTCHSRFNPHSIDNKLNATRIPFHCCAMCDKRYKWIKDLRKHIQLKHSVHRNHCCTMCDKRYNWQKDLKSHILSKHAGSVVVSVESSDLSKATSRLVTYPSTIINRNVSAENITSERLRCSVDFTGQSDKLQVLQHNSTVKPSITNTGILNASVNPVLAVSSQIHFDGLISSVTSIVASNRSVACAAGPQRPARERIASAMQQSDHDDIVYQNDTKSDATLVSTQSDLNVADIQSNNVPSKKSNGVNDQSMNFNGLVVNDADEFNTDQPIDNIKQATVKNISSSHQQDYQQTGVGEAADLQDEVLEKTVDDNIDCSKRCPICRMMFDEIVELTSHMEEHMNPISSASQKAVTECISSMGQSRGMQKDGIKYIPKWRGLSVGCSMCGMKFAAHVDLKSHIKEHLAEYFLCGLCNDKLLTISDLKDHYFTKHRSGPGKYMSCTSCSFKSHSFRDFSNHMRNHTGERPFKCTQCDRTFMAIHSIKKHVESHSGFNTYTCPQCNLKFNRDQADLFKLHRQSHSDPRPFVCTRCDKRFMCSATLRKHVRGVHKKIRNCICTQCGRAYKSKHLLDNHVRQMHTGERPFICTVCGKSFSSTRNLRIHEKFHGIKTHACERCETRFFTVQSLNHHIRIVHNGERRYSCDQCKKKFGTKTGLKTHMVTHTGARSFACKLCDKKFSAYSSRIRHVQESHVGEERYKCPHCDMMLTQKTSLIRHVSLLHGNKCPYVCAECKRRFTDAFLLRQHLQSHE